MTSRTKSRKYIRLPVDFLESEKGNTMLVNNDSMVAWIRLDEKHYLEISDTPGNSPRLYVSVVSLTEDNIRQHITDNLVGWYVIRWGLPGDPPVNKNGEISWG